MTDTILQLKVVPVQWRWCSFVTRVTVERAGYYSFCSLTDFRRQLFQTTASQVGQNDS